MFPPEKIEEWLQEVEQRPASAALVIQFIANRLSDLSQQNEQLRAENIALRTGQRVREYEQRIGHLEYQLDLLKRQFSAGLPEAQALALPGQPPETASLLMYDPSGRILRLELAASALEDGSSLASLRGLPLTGELPRLVVVPSSEELLCAFTSGRIASLPVASIPLASPEAEWQTVHIPHEPAIGDALACLTPVSKMALADFFVQISRRGFMKKIRIGLAASIIANRYIGTGVKLPADRTLAITLGHEKDTFVLLSWEGVLQGVAAGMLSFAVEEAVRLDSTDHLVAAFPCEPGQSIVVMTQIGKIIHRAAESIELAEALQRRGRALYSKERREKGVRVVGGAAVSQDDWGLALHREGGITLHAISSLCERGVIPVAGEILAFSVFSSPEASH